MRVLVACEFSGVVRDAFAARGHDAWSCDLLPSERPGQHIQGDVLDVLKNEWFDLMIAHPPCTYLCNSGVRWLWTAVREAVEGDRDEAKFRDGIRWARMREAGRFFHMLLHETNVPRVAVENPIMHKYGREAAGCGRATQVVQPWMFGHPEKKATCLWLRGLPKLEPTNIVRGPLHARVHREPPSPERWKNRSRTYQGMADAMADQWSGQAEVVCSHATVEAQ